MKIKLLMITHNRPDYTRRSLARLCDSMPAHGKVVVWDNASSEKTVSLLKKFEVHPKIEKIVYHPVNERLNKPTNWFWKYASDCDLLGKVDDDCLVPENWCYVLQKAHMDIPDAGLLGCWHFLPEDFNETFARRKIQEYGKHRILRNCWIGGSGYLMKRAVLTKNGHLRTDENFSDYCLRTASQGFVNGWYFPFLYQEHMDDPRTPHAGLNTEDDFLRSRPLSAENFKIESREAWIARLRHSAQLLQMYSYDPNDFISLRAKLKRTFTKILGREYIPLVK